MDTGRGRHSCSQLACGTEAAARRSGPRRAAAVRVNSGLPSVEGLATDPQGRLFHAGTGGGIVRILPAGAGLTNRRPARRLGLRRFRGPHFADRQLRNVSEEALGRVEVIAENSPRPRLAVGPGGSIYVTDSAACAFTASAPMARWRSRAEVNQPKAIVISNDGQSL
jgi:hypothetical protein